MSTRLKKGKRNYAFMDKTISASFTHADAVSPEEAQGILAEAIGAIGGELVDGFNPTEEEHRGDPGYIEASMRLRLPDGRSLWVSVECPSDACYI